MPVYRRMLFVGLGGSGGKTLRFLKRDLHSWLDSVGWSDGMPLGWQFLQVDTPTTQDGTEIRSAAMLPSDEYLGLVGRGTTFSDIDRSLMSAPENVGEFATWRVKPEGLGVPVHTGAGMYRAVGRTVALAYLPQIRERLERSFSQLNQPESQASLSALYRHVHRDEPAVEIAAPIVVVISSLAGGTGAGLINDVCDLLREIDPVAGGASYGLLYTPEVFKDIAPQKKGGIQPNSLAAICEVLNGYWWNGGSGAGPAYIPLKNSQLMKSAGAAAPYEKTGPAFPFLIGAENSAGVNYEKSETLFQVVGAALTSWATDITVQDRLLSYTYANWVARANAIGETVHVNTLVNEGSAGDNETGTNPFNALGFARVSVGNRYFGRYSTQRLTREAVEFLRYNHDRGAFAQTERMRQPNVTPRELVEKQCAQQFGWFISLCQLDEKGPNTNQLQDAISPTRSEWEGIFNQCLDQAVSWARQDGNRAAIDWMATIEPAIENSAVKFDEMCQPIIDERLLTWISGQPQVVMDAVSQAVGQFGIRVAEALVARLIQEINDPNEGIIADLQREITEYSSYAVKGFWSGKCSASFTEPTRRVPFGPVIEEACREGLEHAICTTWVRVKTLAIELLNQFASGYLEPLRLSLSRAQTGLEEKGGMVDSWPTWSGPGQTGSLSEESKPPMSEWTLIKPDSFPALFDDLLARTIGGNLIQRETHREIARTHAICGAFLDERIATAVGNSAGLQSLKLINMTSEWWPGVAVVRDSHKPPVIASFSIGLDVDQIEARANLWLREEDGPFAKVLQDSLRSYTMGSQGHINPHVTDQDYADRRRAFLAAFEAAVSASRPLVGMDTQLMAFLFGSADHPWLEIEVSSIPFGGGHPLYDAVHARLDADFKKLPTRKVAAEYFSDSSLVNHVDIVTSLHGAYPVLVIESLLKPIAQAWNSITTDKGREAFWDKRRARRLVEFIPAPQEHVLCMLRGWFLGHSLGLIHRTQKTEPWSVAPRGHKTGRFPKKLPRTTLSTSPAWGDQPALVLESLGIAYVEVGIQNNLEPLLGFVHLLELGKEGDGLSSTLGTYSRLADYVVEWIRTGNVKTPEGFIPERGPRLKTDVALLTPHDRVTALIDHLESRRARYRREFAQYESSTRESVDGLGRAPLWPSLNEPIIGALTQIIDSLIYVRDGEDSAYSDDDDE